MWWWGGHRDLLCECKVVHSVQTHQEAINTLTKGHFPILLPTPDSDNEANPIREDV